MCNGLYSNPHKQEGKERLHDSEFRFLGFFFTVWNNFKLPGKQIFKKIIVNKLNTRSFKTELSIIHILQKEQKASWPITKSQVKSGLTLILKVILGG